MEAAIGIESALAVVKALAEDTLEPMALIDGVAPRRSCLDSIEARAIDMRRQPTDLPVDESRTEKEPVRQRRFVGRFLGHWKETREEEDTPVGADHVSQRGLLSEEFSGNIINCSL